MGPFTKHGAALLLAAVFGAHFSAAQTAPPNTPPAPIQVMTLGVFHFDYPNLDQHQIQRADQIDVLAPRYQAELTQLANALARYRPTHILVEAPPAQQARFDSLYRAYVAGRHALRRNEREQLGFRLARQLGLPRVWGVDATGSYYPSLQQLFNDTARLRRFERYLDHSPDSVFERRYRALYAAEDLLPARVGVVATLAQLNEPANLLHKQGAYLVGGFKYEEESQAYTGVDFETSRWYSRNLRILRNMQRLPIRPGDRVLLIIGAGHAGLLNYFLQCSPEYELVSAGPYLRPGAAKPQATLPARQRK
ncbi:mitochondrial RNA-splicing protein MRS1 [Hymenobacter busanensis]|uniref:Mitochondrial RNA-splicing protein MRS1 n=1 Tax=Hymenobacter busanensis TaxID=2607656 RepID=A0A7L4ZVQ3_9BACT|nr:DUF5694 domain-containing protein [Hymenobacter busanensis]KAA9339312.1 mitochondrial RNA-splicing protein MRS1 [Hymenobacter busanensis]QHJ06926.1 hypothetical protein GUY19_06335 [Hymenobacter busanensis]